jgi:hypothetical protein
MREILTDAREELKRADHLLYVSLKYTRTVDVIRSIIERLLNSIELLFGNLLEHAKEEKKIDEISSNIGLRAEMVKELYPDNEVLVEMVNFYFTMKKILRAEYRRSREFRRHVTMTAITDFGVVEIDIDRIKEHYFKVQGFLKHVEVLLYGEESEF